ncbi:MAG: hypothetical protein HPY69_09250 [Armatimonadetes bacterium]|nr:hypothetical protein [Armatimonadota bacterium]
MTPGALTFCLGLLVLLTLSMISQSTAEPVTLYKPADIANARANLERYQWARDILAGYRSTVAYAMSLDCAALRAMVPDLTPWSTYGQVCPACVGEKCAMGESGVWKWSARDPEKLTCKYCGRVYPDPAYPETGVLECPQMGQTFTYYLNDEQRAHPDEDPGRYAYQWAGRPVQVSFTGVIRAQKLAWAMEQVLPLAKLYALTGDLACAERVQWLLERLAEVFPTYLYHSYGGCFADCDPAEAAREMGRNPRAGKFPPGVIRHPAARMRDMNNDGFGDLDAGFWGSGRLTPGVGGEGALLLSFTVAYDLTREATLPDGRPLYTAAQREQIERDLLLAGCADLENYADINNKAGPGRALSGAIGMMFGQPARVRRALEGFERLMQDCFHFDGFCKESPSYSGMHLGNMEEIPDLLAGYSDPPDYQPASGPRLENFDPFRHTARYGLALQSMVRMLRQDLRYPVIGDTHSGGGASPHFVEILTDRIDQSYASLLVALQGRPLEEAGSEYALWHRDPNLRTPPGPVDAGLRTEYFPGWQVGVLRAGMDETRTSLYFNGYCAHGHRHADTLGLIYHAYNTELASDRGYIADDPRKAWASSTLAHNIVAVDGENQNAVGRHSSLELFGVAPGLEVIEARADAYKQCSVYRRLCALVRLPEGGNYAVDIFRVVGGRLHQYALNANGEFLGLEGADMQPVEGKISWLTNLRAGRVTGRQWRATWQQPAAALTLLMAGTVDRVVVADAPGWRSNKGTELHAPPITQVLAERTGESEVSSLFTAVLSPSRTASAPVRAVSRLTPDTQERDADADDAVAVVVDLGDRRDYIISAPDDNPRTYGPVTLAGRFGYASVSKEGQLLRGYLLDGTELVCGETRLRLPVARVERRVQRVEGSVVELDAPVPEASALAGSYLITGDTGFEIEAIEGAQLRVRDYPFVGGETIVIPQWAWYQRP